MSSPPIIAAGLCILAEDTGRVLLLQRSFADKSDPAAGKFEVPGGHLEGDESPLEGARREFEEEVGHRLPASVSVRSDYVDGIYQLFVATVPNESDIKINRPLDRRVRNPDGDEVETVVWWRPKDMENNKSIRSELARNVSSKFKWAVRLAKLRARRMEKSASASASGVSNFVESLDAKLRRLAQSITNDPMKASAIRAAIYGAGAGGVINAMSDPGYDSDRHRKSQVANVINGALGGAAIGAGTSTLVGYPDGMNFITDSVNSGASGVRDLFKRALGGMEKSASASIPNRSRAISLLLAKAKQASFDQKVVNLARLMQFEFLYAKRAGLKETVSGLKETASQLLSDGGQFVSEKLQDPSTRPLVTGAVGALGGAGSMLVAEALNKSPRKKQYLTSALSGAVAGGAAGVGGGIVYNHLVPSDGTTTDLRPEMERLRNDPAAFTEALNAKSKQDAQNSLSAHVRNSADIGGVGVEAAGALTGAALADSKTVRSISPFSPFAVLDKEYVDAPKKQMAQGLADAADIKMAVEMEPKVQEFSDRIKNNATAAHASATASKAEIQAKWDAAKAEFKQLIESKSKIHAADRTAYDSVHDLFNKARDAEVADLKSGNETRPLMDYVKAQTGQKINSKQLESLAEERSKHVNHDAFLEAMNEKHRAEMSKLTDKQRATDVKFQKMMDGIKVPDSNALLEQLMAEHLSGDPSAKAKLDILKKRMGVSSLGDLATQYELAAATRDRDSRSQQLDRYNKLVSGDVEPIIDYDPDEKNRLKRNLSWLGHTPERRSVARRGAGAVTGGLIGFLGDQLWQKINGE